MSDAGRNLKPTPKRVREFRKRGEVASSKELTTAASLGLGFAAACLLASTSWSALCAMTATGASGQPLVAVAGAAQDGFRAGVMPALIGALIGCVLVGGLQLGWPPIWRWPTFDFLKPLKLAGAREALSGKAMIRRLLSALVRLAIIIAVVALVARGELTAVATSEPHALVSRLGHAVLAVGLAGGATLLVVGGFDYLHKRRSLGNKMKMTANEMRQEMREAEGDPQIKGSRRRRMRELSKRRAVAATRTADVVLVNPTHYAVALRYRAADGGAPRVVAKGVDELALRMREAARAAGVPVISRPPLARALHKMVKEGNEIPGALYHAVAEVLAYVYRLRERRSGRAS